MGNEKDFFSAKQTIEDTHSFAGKNAYQWAHACRYMPDGFTYSIFTESRRMAYLYEMYVEAASLRSPGGKIVIMKSAQMGLSEFGINVALWFMDMEEEPALYMLPTEPQLGAFVEARLDHVIASSQYIRQGFSGETDGVSLRTGWDQNLNLRSAGLVDRISDFSASLVVMDERDQMSTESVAMAYARQDATRNKWKVLFSSPSLVECGIHLEYLGGSRGKFALFCPECGEYVVPEWPDSANRNHPNSVMCPSYDHELDKMNGKWIHAVPNAPYKSYSIDSFASPTVSAGEMLDRDDAIDGDPVRMKAFFNLTLGQPTVELKE